MSSSISYNSVDANSPYPSSYGTGLTAALDNAKSAEYAKSIEYAKSAEYAKSVEYLQQSYNFYPSSSQRRKSFIAVKIKTLW